MLFSIIQLLFHIFAYISILQGRKLKQQAYERLKTEKGIFYRKKRPADVEPVFANIKHNKNFKRFLLKGIHKTEIEWGLFCIAHNLKKIAA